MCDQCDYVSTKSWNLKKHVEAKHEGVKYQCDQCDYTATFSRSIKTHIEAKHEGIRYYCDQCDYAATQQNSLKTHIQSQHEMIRHEYIYFILKNGKKGSGGRIIFLIQGFIYFFLT